MYDFFFPPAFCLFNIFSTHVSKLFLLKHWGLKKKIPTEKWGPYSGGIKESLNTTGFKENKLKTTQERLPDASG